MKRFISVLVIMVWVLVASVTAFADDHNGPLPDYTNDFSGVLTEDEVLMLDEQAGNLYGFAEAQVVIATVNNLDGKPIKEFTKALANSGGITDRTMSMLVLLYTGSEPDVCIYAGTEIRKVFKKDTSQFEEYYAVPYIKDGNYAKALFYLQTALIHELQETISKSVTTGLQEQIKGLNSQIAQLKTATTQSNTKVEKTVTNNTNDPFFLIWLLLTPAGVFAGLFLFFFLKWKGLKSQFTATNKDAIANKIALDTIKKERDAARAEAESKTREVEAAIREVNANRALLEWAYKVHPRLDQEIEAKKAEEKKLADELAATSFDAAAMQVLKKNPSSDLLSEVTRVYEHSETLTPDQRALLKTNTQELENLKAACEKIKQEEDGKALDARIARAIEGSKQGTEEQFTFLNGIYEDYERSNHAIQQYVDVIRLQNFLFLLNQSKEHRARKMEMRQDEPIVRRNTQSGYTSPHTPSSSGMGSGRTSTPSSTYRAPSHTPSPRPSTSSPRPTVSARPSAPSPRPAPSARPSTPSPRPTPKGRP